MRTRLTAPSRTTEVSVSPAIKLAVIYYLEYRLSVLDLQRKPTIQRAD